jgi:DNA-binding response OmpR family regulator
MSDSTKATILYAEDDEALSFLTIDSLGLHGYKLDHYANGGHALKAFGKNKYDLCVLDIMLPEMDGLQIAREIRKTNQQIPIIFLTAKSLKEDRIEGLKTGADDYLTKPYSIEELILKIEIFLRRKFISEETEVKQLIGNYSYDHSNLKLSLAGTTKDLTQKEGELLHLLNNNRNTILKRSEILQRLWGNDDYFLGRSMDVFISRLRKYLKEDDRLKIENVHGVGFRFICPA